MTAEAVHELNNTELAGLKVLSATMRRETNGTPTSVSVQDRELWNIKERRRVFPSFIFPSD